VNTNGNEILMLLVRWQRTTVDIIADSMDDFMVPNVVGLGNQLRQSL